MEPQSVSSFFDLDSGASILNSNETPENVTLDSIHLELSLHEEGGVEISVDNYLPPLTGDENEEENNTHEILTDTLAESKTLSTFTETKAPSGDCNDSLSNTKAAVRQRFLNNLPPPRTFKNKESFMREMESAVGNVVNECIGVLQQDPRGYHPFYLRVYKFVTVGKRLGFINEDDVNFLWRKFDDYAVGQFRRWENGEFCDFIDEQRHSLYLNYLRTKKVIFHGSEICVRYQTQARRQKKFLELNSIARKFRKDWATEGVSDEEVLNNLKHRLAFFKYAKEITFPGDMAQINTLWKGLLYGFPTDIQKKSVAKEKRAEPQEIVKRSGRERRAPKRFEPEFTPSRLSKSEKSFKTEMVDDSEKDDVEATCNEDVSLQVADPRNAWKSVAKKAIEGGPCPYCGRILTWQLSRHIREVHLKMKPKKRNPDMEVAEEVSNDSKKRKLDDKTSKISKKRGRPRKNAVEMNTKNVVVKEKPLSDLLVEVKNEGAECPHCHLKVMTTLDRHISYHHVITPDGTVHNRPSRQELKGLPIEERKKRYSDWLRLKRMHRTEEERKEESRRLKEKYYKKLSSMTPEQLRDFRMKNRFQQFQKRLEKQLLPDEDRRSLSTLKFVQRQAWLSKKDKEWKEEKSRRLKEWSRRRRENMTPEEREEERRKHKEYRESLTGEKLARYRESVKRSVRKYFDKLRRERPEEYYNKTKASWGKVLDYQRERVKNETPEQREARLLRYRINQAKRKARQELEREGASPYEIERRMKEVEEFVRSQPRPAGASQYKPRLGARKPHNVQKSRFPQDFEPKINQSTENAQNSVEIAAPSEPVQNLLENPEQLPVAVSDPIVVTATPLQLPEPAPTSVMVLAPFREVVTGQSFFIEFDPGPTLALVHSVTTTNTAATMTTAISSLHTIDNTTPIVTYDHVSPSPLSCAGNDSQSPESLEHDPSSIEIFSVAEALPSQQPPPANIQAVIITTPTAEPPTSVSFPFVVPAPQVSIDELIQVPVSLAPATPIVKSDNDNGNTADDKVTSCPPSRQTAMCDECGKTFTTQFSVQLHKNVIHAVDPSVLICPKCQHPCSSTISLWNHFASNHLEDVEAFPEDLFPSKRKRQLGPPRPPSEPYKQIRSDPNNPHFCGICGKSFVQKCTLDDHIRRVHEGKGHICEVCGRDQQSTAKLWRHKVERHGMTGLPPPAGVPAVTCKYCNEIVMRGYEQHVKKRHPENLEEFLSWYNPEEGTAPRRHLAEKVKCPHCPSIVKQKLLNRHIKNIHTNRPKHPCPECGFQFKRLDHMKKHYRDHHAIADIEKKLEAKQLIKVASIRNFSATCLLCQTEFTSKVVLRAHFVKEHHQIFQNCQVASLPIFECPTCEDKFSKESELKSHIESSHPDKLFTCQHCGVFKYSQSELTTHEKMHKHNELGKMRRQGKCCLCDFDAGAIKQDGTEAQKSAEEIKAFLETSIRLHVQNHHSDHFFPCPNANCKKFCLNKEGFQNHLIRCQKNAASKTKEFVAQKIDKLKVFCKECRRPYRLNQLDKHMKTVHDNNEKQEFPCEQCKPRVFKCVRYYVAHMHLVHQISLQELLDLAPDDAPMIRTPRKRGKYKKRNIESEEEVEGGGWSEEYSGNYINKKEASEKKTVKRKIGPKSKTQPKENEDDDRYNLKTKKINRRGRKPGIANLRRGHTILPMIDIEKEKKLIVSVERMSDDIFNFYLARCIIVKTEPEY